MTHKLPEKRSWIHKLVSINLKMHQLITAVFLSGICMLTSCEQDTINVDDIADEANRTYEFAGPLSNLHISVEDFLEEVDEEGWITKDAEGNLYYEFSEEYPFEIDDVYTLSDVNYSWYYTPVELPSKSTLKASNALIPYDDVTYTETITMSEDEGIRLDRMIISGADLNLNINTPAGLQADVKISLPEVSKDGEILSTTFSVDGTPGNNTYSLQQSLAGYEIEFQQDEANPAGIVNVVIEFTNISLEIDPLSPAIPTPVEVNFLITDIEPDVAFGYFDARPMDTESIDLEFDAFEDMNINSLVEFGNIWIDVNTSSTIGVPFEASINEISFLDTYSSTSKTLELDDNTFSVEAATYGNPVTPSLANKVISGDNSNILEMELGVFQPNRVIGEIATNIVSSDPSQSYFISRTSEVNASVNIKIPLWFKASQYARTDTVDFNYVEEVGEGEDDDFTENFEEATIHLNMSNGIPFDIMMQVSFRDANYNIVDKLFDTPVSIAGPEVDANGIVTKLSASSFSAQLSQEQMELFRDSEVMYIFVETLSATSENGEKLVRIREDNYCDISISMEAKGNIE
ncbi:hypothetical protein OM074_11615 [Marinilabiliaceae bacterium D04]|uniref:Uncharacterized protein n=2 Tax=Plebeiibacterium marinum TaxID=2992111 RepID=A0AAE3SK93_9BACT|nr:hypothetical protein [Plebeiobacterium marinum]